MLVSYTAAALWMGRTFVVISDLLALAQCKKMEDKKKKNVGRRVKLELSAHTYSHLSVSNFGQFQCLKKKKKHCNIINLYLQ